MTTHAPALARTTVAAARGHWFSRNPSKAWAEKFFLLYTPVWMLGMGLQMRTGVGFNYLSDDYDTNFGFNFTYGGDWYLARPWVLSAEMDLGWLGEATVVHLRGTVGANWRFAEAYLGYDYYDIGRANVGGMVAGVRLWF